MGGQAPSPGGLKNKPYTKVRGGLECCGFATWQWWGGHRPSFEQPQYKSFPGYGGRGPLPSLEDQRQEALARQVLEEIATMGTSPEVPLDEYMKVLADYRATGAIL